MRVEEEARDAKESDQIMYCHVHGRDARVRSAISDASGSKYIDFCRNKARGRVFLKCAIHIKAPEMA